MIEPQSMHDGESALTEKLTRVVAPRLAEMAFTAELGAPFEWPLPFQLVECPFDSALAGSPIGRGSGFTAIAVNSEEEGSEFTARGISATAVAVDCASVGKTDSSVAEAAGVGESEESATG